MNGEKVASYQSHLPCEFKLIDALLATGNWQLHELRQSLSR